MESLEAAQVRRVAREAALEQLLSLVLMRQFVQSTKPDDLYQMFSHLMKTAGNAIKNDEMSQEMNEVMRNEFLATSDGVLDRAKKFADVALSDQEHAEDTSPQSTD